ncbi:MAG: tRNA (adenosine(37)-N6)-threonylcarbamoyltransferase complex transferase subunit TsaD [Turicibacter sp.]|nr:tRNA (adenosine(37)-N6)-threonylcarbamoyltransferase complex transferase subunit TsaD [Turicibacter sp.]
MSLILGIETSCDETAAAVVEDGKTVISNVISSQIDVHREYGGVVPEIASRKHLESISFIVKEALGEIDLSKIDGIAVSNGPGLAGALLVGLSFAKSLAFATKKPLYGVHHIYSHICANYLEREDWQPPFVCLVVSGGHTHLIHVKDYSDCEVVGRTRDDAAGEAFDKVGRTLGLPYPGGPEIDKAAKLGDPASIPFPRTSFENSLDFSFSGLKSAVLQYKQKRDIMEYSEISNVAASFQEAVIDVLVSRSLSLCDALDLPKLAIAGGVAANLGLRNRIAAECRKKNIDFNLPSMVYCTDNAAMVAGAGFYRHLQNAPDNYDLNAFPTIEI